MNRKSGQALLASSHFVLSYKKSGDDFVYVCSSLDTPLSDHHKLQLSMIYGRENTDVTVRSMTVQKQPPPTLISVDLWSAASWWTLLRGDHLKTCSIAKRKSSGSGCVVFSRVTSLKLVQGKDLVDDPRTLWCQRIKISLLLLAMPRLLELVYPKAQQDSRDMKNVKKSRKQSNR